MQGVANPRNSKQVKNALQKRRGDQLLSRDDLYNFFQLSSHLDGFVKQLTLYPDLVAVVSLPEIITQFNQLLDVKSDEQLYLSYDTTFNLGDCYVSAIVFKHILFKETPLIPLAFVIHDRKFGSVHETLFNFLKFAVPKISKKRIPIVVDREAGIRKAIKNILPDCPILTCWNHLRNDFKYWLNQKKVSPDNIRLYHHQLKQMLQCDSENEFLELSKDLTSKWTSEVVSYFEKELKTDILERSGKWVLEQFEGLYDPYSGITNNLSESYNAVLKQENDWKELPVDMLALGFHFLQNFDHYEILRGLAGVGDYHLKTEFSRAKIDIHDLFIPKKLIAPSDIISYLKTAHVNTPQLSSPSAATTETVEDLSDSKTEHSTPTTPKEKDTPIINTMFDFPAFVSSQHALAKYIVDNNLITLVPSQAAFIVQGRNGKYCVTLFPKETCQCPSTTTCFHILAAKMSIGQEPIEKRPVVSLRVLTKNNRKRVDKKSGKKQPRQNDYDPVVEPAPDSAYLVNTPKTPSQVHSTQKSPQKSALKTKSKTPHSKKKLHFNLETVSEEEIDTCPISPDEKKDNIITLDDTPPGKKRKLDFPSPPISIEIEQEKKQPWIGTLTQVDKKTISDSKCLTSDIVNYAQNILSKQFPLIQGFQNTCYAPVFCNQQKKWLSETSFTPTQAPAVQIHHTGHSHWVTSLTKQSNEVYLLDSMYDTLTTSSEIQLSQIYSHGKKRLLVKLPEVQKQTNSIDCGLFAIANAVEFCFTSFSGGIHVEFDTELLREHLVICLEKGEFIPFPKKKISMKGKPKYKTSVVECNCECGKCDSVEDMLGCEWQKGVKKCNIWKHFSCTGLKDGDTFLCSKHITN